MNLTSVNLLLLCYCINVDCNRSDIYNSGILERYFITKHLHVNICVDESTSKNVDMFFKQYTTTSDFTVDTLNMPTYREYNITRNLPNSLVFLCNVEQLYQLKYNPHWNSRSRIIVIIDQSLIINVKDVLNILWNSTRSVDVNVIVDSETYFDVYTWYPYTQNNCDSVNDVVHVNHWEKGRLINGSIEAMHKVMKRNMHGCNLYITSVFMMPFSSGDMNMEGVEDKIIITLVQHFNLTLTRVPPPSNLAFYPPVYKGKLGGSTSLLHSYKTDLVYGGMRFIKLRYDLTDALTPYFQDYLTWLVPAIKNEAYGKRIFLVFSISIWGLIVLVHICLILLVKIIGRLKNEKKFTNLSACIVYLLAVLLSVSACQSPQTYFLKYFLCLVSLYYINISTAYQSSLIVMMTKPNIDDSFKNAIDAIEGGLTIYLFPTLPAYKLEFNNPNWEKIMSENVVFSENKYQTLKEIANNKSAMTLSLYMTAEYIINKKYLDKYGESKIKFIDKQFVLFPLSIFMSRGNPLKKTFELSVQKITESGLISYWAAEIMRIRQDVSYNHEDTRSLTLEHFTGCFYLLFLGLMFGFVAFICEFRKHRYFNKILW